MGFLSLTYLTYHRASSKWKGAGLHAQQTDGEVEYWLARDLQHLLGYDQWRNFAQVISKAKVACEVSGHEVSDH